MEKDSDYPSLGDTVDENTENKGYEHIGEFHRDLIVAQAQELCEKMQELKQALDKNEREMKQMENIMLFDTTSQLSPPDTVYPVSPMASPIYIYEPQDLSKHTSGNMNFSPFLTGIDSTLSEVIYDPNAVFSPTVIEGFFGDSLQRASDTETQVSETDVNSPQCSTCSEEIYDGKGKEAANPKFRYKKQSKPVVSSRKASSQLTPVKPSKEAPVASETKTPESQSSEIGITRIPPTVKRKEMIPSEGCSTWTSNLYDDNDDLKIAKKLKFDDDDRASLQCPTLTRLLSQTNYERPFFSPYIDPSSKENEQLAVASTSGLSKVVMHASPSEDSKLTRGS